ncbi:MAG: alpha-amylase family glycosyl hydrolase [Acidimicrobiia bacterium]|nr:alpha-amylase family glycosyl hydrolase [Acidimicrobiia bacterium]
MEPVSPLPDHLASSAVAKLGVEEGDAFATRAGLRWPDLITALENVYGRGGLDLATRLAKVALEIVTARPPDLRRLDRQREIDPEWFQRPEMVGYVAYADRFAGTLQGVRDRIGYLEELGITYLHLMPLLMPREGVNDGGYAVADYDAVDPGIGTMEDLVALAADLHERGLSLCVDLVINHTAREHGWAKRAIKGDPRYRAFYRIYPDRDEPDRYEATLREIFPDTAPGSFTFSPEVGGWVWTTFHDYQWDLNYENPDVVVAMAEVMGRLANRGVDVLRLDAVPFIWKRLGTDCENQPEAHRILQAFRAVMAMATPGVLLKAEAIVPPDDLVQYLGAHDDAFRPECDLAYHNLLMVMLWSSLASRDARLMRAALTRLRPAPASTSWVTYVRCHDDIGWAVTDEDAATVGWGGFSHRSFLNDYYSGSFNGSFARGALFQRNPATGDARISGSAASLCGIELALRSGDSAQVEAGIRRLLLLYNIAYSYGGIPLVYMGDEVALRNDFTYLEIPERAADNRWMHRPAMDWVAAAKRGDRQSLEQVVFAGFQRLARTRAAVPSLHAAAAPTMLSPDDDAVFAFARRHPTSRPFLGLSNFADFERTVDAGVLAAAGIDDPVTLLSSDGDLEIDNGRIVLPGLGFVWVGG